MATLLHQFREPLLAAAARGEDQEGIGRSNTHGTDTSDHHHHHHHTLVQHYLAGPGYKYNVTVSLDLKLLRSLLHKPPPVESAALHGLTPEELASRHAAFSELEDAHGARHLQPLPASLRGSISRGLCALLMLSAAMLLVLSTAGAHAEAAIDGEHGAAVGAKEHGAVGGALEHGALAGAREHGAPASVEHGTSKAESAHGAVEEDVDAAEGWETFVDTQTSTCIVVLLVSMMPHLGGCTSEVASLHLVTLLGRLRTSHR